MEETTKKRVAPFSLRLSEEERQCLEKLAGSMSLSAYIKDCALGGSRSAERRRKPPVEDKKALAKALALLGQSSLSQNMKRLATYADQGSLPLEEDLRRELQTACLEIASMRSTLMRALGMQGEER